MFIENHLGHQCFALQSQACSGTLIVRFSGGLVSAVARPRLPLSAASCTLTSPPAIPGPWPAVTGRSYFYCQPSPPQQLVENCSSPGPLRYTILQLNDSKVGLQLLIFNNQRQHYYVEISLSWAVAWIRSWQHVTAQHRQR